MAVSLISTLGGELGFGGNLLPRNDDGSTPAIDLSSVFENGLNFFGSTYTSLYVNNNGGVSFNGPLGAYTPQTISSGTTPGIFPFWADVDTDGGPSMVSPGGASQGTNLVYYTLDVANDRFVATWDDVGYYSENTDRVNAFQLILTDRSTTPGRTAGDFDIEIRYEWIDWTAGDASDGEGGLGGTTARAGYSAGNGIFFELPQAGNETAMLALEDTPGNTGVDGLWRFGVFNGNVPPTISISSAPDVTEGDSGITNMVFQVERSGDVSGTLTVDWTATGFLPQAANSFDVDGMLPRGGTLTFADGETVKTLTIGILGDTVIEPDEMIVVTLRNAASSTGEAVNYASVQGFGQIINDDFPPPSVTGPEADVWGDPHLVTLDGLGYDFQAVGEFTLVQSVSGTPINAQIRTAPLSDVVSAITAMATEINGVRVMIDATRDTPLSIDGVLTPLTASDGALQVGNTGAEIYANSGVYTVILPSGEQFMVGVFDNGTMNVCTFLSDARPAGSVRGLLGNADGNGGNDLALPDGTVLTQPVSFDTLYSTFADAWRITEPNALFDRAPGETTADYQDTSYPRGHITVADLPADIRAAAEAAVQAAGITDPVIAEAAVLDFALTGDPTFITGATMLAATPTGATDPTNTPAPLPTLLISSEEGHAEGDAGTSTFRFTIDRIVSTAGALDVAYAIGGDVDAGDISGPLTGNVSFADGETEKTIEVVVSGDTDVEADEALTVSISTATPGSVLFANTSATTVVLDDDGVGSIVGTSAGEVLNGDASDNLIQALGGNDTVFAGAGNDQVFGDDGDDALTGAGGDDLLDGGAGTDTAHYSGNQAAYTLTLTPVSTTLSDRRADGNGSDALTGIEFLDFDTDILGGPFDLTKFGGPTGLSQDDFESFIELYIAYFNRAPDAVGLNFWGTAFATGTSLSQMAALFIDQDETRMTYPDTLSNADFATAVYNNVLGRIPDIAGFNFWVGVLDSNDVGRDQFILEVLRGARADPPPGASQDFIDQQMADQEYLAVKVVIGAYFSVHKGMSDVPNARAAMAEFDGTTDGFVAAKDAIDGFYASALDPDDGEFLMPLVGVLDAPDFPVV